jgi:hypothetical protein
LPGCQSAIPPIGQLPATGHSASGSLSAVLIGPVRYFTLDFAWRFLTGPVSHACRSGLTGYFIGLAVTRRHQWYAVAWTGLAAAAVLHGLNDWGRVNGRPLRIVVVAVSAILFLSLAKTGSGSTRSLPAMPGPGRAALLRCPGAGHQGLGGNTKILGTSGRSRAIRAELA